MDRDLYIVILDKDMMDSISYFDKTPFDTIFQQDNNPKHICKKAKDWFKNGNIQIIPCPVQSPFLDSVDSMYRRVAAVIKAKDGYTKY